MSDARQNRRRREERRPDKYNLGVQYYRGIPLTLILYTEAHFAALRAKRFILGDPRYNQNLWIPNAYLEPNGTIKPGWNLDWVFLKAARQNKLRLAHVDVDPTSWTAREETTTT